MEGEETVRVARRLRGSVRVQLTVLVGILVVLAPAGAATALDDVHPERILLYVTADPATSQAVTWRSDVPFDAVLEIAPVDAPQDITTFEADDVERDGHVYFQATATELDPRTTYRYRVGSGGIASTRWETFTTATASAEPFRFLYFGDTQHSGEGIDPAVAAALEAAPDAELAVHIGDLVDDGHDESQWQDWYEAFSEATTRGMRHFAAAGNHEYDDDNFSPVWGQQFPHTGTGPSQDSQLQETVSYTDYQGVRFISLNSNYRTVPSDERESWLDAQADWLDGVLETNVQDWTVVMFHHPLYSGRPERDNIDIRDAWGDLLEDHDVDLVLQGHDHSYSRGNLVANRTDDDGVHTGPVYIIANSSPKTYPSSTQNWRLHDAEARIQDVARPAYQVVEVDGNTLEYEAVTARGHTLDEFSIVNEGADKRVLDHRAADSAEP